MTRTADKVGLKATELVEILNFLIEKHGDCRVFSRADYEMIEAATYYPQKEDSLAEDEPLFVLDW